MPGCRCPRCLPLFKTSNDSEDGHKVRSRTLLAQSRKLPPVNLGKASRASSSGKATPLAALKKAPLKQKAARKSKSAPGEAPRAEVKHAVEKDKRGKKESTKPAPPVKRVSAAVKQIKAWLQGVKKEFQKPKTEGKAVKAEPTKKAPAPKSGKKKQMQKTAPHHFPIEPATSSSRSQFPRLAPSALSQVGVLQLHFPCLLGHPCKSNLR